jgi:hypothetical protein
VRASTGDVVATLVGTGISSYAAFDGSRVLTGLSLWDAQSLQLIRNLDFSGPACSDGINFWITMPIDLTNYVLARF